MFGRLDQERASRPLALASEARILLESEQPDWSGGLVGEVLSGYLEERRNRAALVITAAAARRGASIKWLDRQRAIVDYFGKSFIVSDARGPVSMVGTRIAANKMLTKHFLERAHVPTPKAATVASAGEAVEFARKHGCSVVVKPTSGGRGRGVTVNIESAADIREAFAAARAVSSSVLVEEFVPFVTEFRCVTDASGVLSVVRRLLPTVRGDGQRMVAELIKDKNRQREDSPSTAQRPIPIDRATVRCIASQGKSLDSVPKMDEVVVVRDVGGLSNGGEAFECSDTAPQEVIDCACDAFRAIPGLHWAGVDVLVSSEGLPSIVEVNTNGDIAGSLFPSYGAPQDLGSAMFMRGLGSASCATSKAESVPELGSPLEAVGLRIPPGRSPDAGVSFNSLAKEEGALRGFRVRSLSPMVVEMVNEDGDEVFLTGCLGTKDYTAVWNVVQRHRLVRKLLMRAGLSVPRARVASSHSMLEKVLQDSRVEKNIVGASSSWDAAVSWAVGSQMSTASERLRPPMLVRNAPRGPRLTVLAGRARAFAAWGPPMSIDDDQVHAAAKLAVRAVRSVPQLRWAAVTLYLGRTLLVEGMSLQPRIPLGTKIVAGDLSDFWDLVFEA